MAAMLNFTGLSAGPLQFSDDCSSSVQKPSSNSSNRRTVSVRASSAVVDTRRPATSLYEVLRIKPGASHSEIKSAYRSLAKVYHPDAAAQRFLECGDRDFIEIRKAYETLSDPSARAMYDMSLMAAQCERNRQFSVSVTPKRYSSGYTRWETDQCW
ncbi:chaperone protein dnaJ 11, chloroplastic-like [Vicia villosa]|uniref:chaperone protein dnaJ 11, chloroplastic-like n=1 Tax=Vicia villosa TaxID=3911 RepID=UPI00273B3503|nr:chaperone protein dnaJ 11, chloroplastic-like [Vicia villosa]